MIRFELELNDEVVLTTGKADEPILSALLWLFNELDRCLGGELTERTRRTAVADNGRRAGQDEAEARNDGGEGDWIAQRTRKGDRLIVRVIESGHDLLAPEPSNNFDSQSASELVVASGASKGERHCSFCGKSRLEVNDLVTGPMVNICNECVALCNDILDERCRD